MIVAYARVSTDGQTLDAQEAQLKAHGAVRIFSEKISGAVTHRNALAKAIASLGEGDTLLVCRLDRLARSTRDLLNVLATISDRKAGRSLADPMIDTTSPHGKLIFGRRPKLSPYQVQEALVRRAAGEALADIGRSYGVSHSTISRL
jgi:DNA invertase Pin-like site-specific DNA recombinase